MDPVLVPKLHQALKATYGRLCFQNISHLTTLLRTVAKSNASLVYLLNCRWYRVYPPFVTRSVRFGQPGRNLERLAARLPQRILRAAIRDARSRLALLESQVNTIWTLLYRTITDVRLWNALTLQKDFYYSYYLRLASQRLQRKFFALRAWPSDGSVHDAQDRNRSLLDDSDGEAAIRPPVIACGLGTASPDPNFQNSIHEALDRTQICSLPPENTFVVDTEDTPGSDIQSLLNSSDQVTDPSISLFSDSHFSPPSDIDRAFADFSESESPFSDLSTRLRSSEPNESSGENVHAAQEQPNLNGTSLLSDIFGRSALSAPLPPAGSMIPVLSRNDIRLNSDVVNLSTTRLTANQSRALNLTLKFCQIPKSVPYLHLIAAVESAARGLDRSDEAAGSQYHAACAEAIQTATVPDPNITKRDRDALAQLQRNNSIIVTSSDKGGKVVILDQNQYTEMVLEHLSDPAYEEIKTFGVGRGKVDLSETPLFGESFKNLDACDCLLRQLSKQLTNILMDLSKNGELDVNERKRLAPGQPYSGALPKFYGLPKLHKVGKIKLRPIIVTTGHHADKLMIKMKQILNTLVWGSTSISNSFELAKLLSAYTFESKDILLSFDVTSLFTKVPVEASLNIIEQRLEEMSNLPDNPIRDITTLSNSGIMKILCHVLGQCFFTWDGSLYRQKSGLPMGGRLSPIISNIFMESLEYQVLCSAVSIPRLFFRYVDDIFIVWNEEEGDYRLFLELLNSLYPEIQLTEEREDNVSLPFLDLRINRPVFSLNQRMCCPMTLEIYRKPTHSDWYLHYKSAHPVPLKRNVLRGLWLRAKRLLSEYPDQLQAELRHLRASFSLAKNGYPKPVIDRWFIEFQRDLIRKPELLAMKTRLLPENIFDQRGRQIFLLPTAAQRYPSAADPTEEDVQIVPDQHLDEDPEIEQLGNLPRRPILVSPYFPGVSEKLKRISGKFDLPCWHTYPGKISDRFTVYRGRLHPSKIQNSVYCTTCTCGLQYVGESNRNLKVRLAEHFSKSSNSALSHHLQSSRHKPEMKDTNILAQERNTFKRKILESLCIHNKSARMCNSGPSTELSSIWKSCAPVLKKELAYSD